MFYCSVIRKRTSRASCLSYKMRKKYMLAALGAVSRLIFTRNIFFLNIQWIFHSIKFDQQLNLIWKTISILGILSMHCHTLSSYLRFLSQVRTIEKGKYVNRVAIVWTVTAVGSNNAKYTSLHHTVFGIWNCCNLHKRLLCFVA